MLCASCPCLDLQAAAHTASGRKAPLGTFMTACAVRGKCCCSSAGGPRARGCGVQRRNECWQVAHGVPARSMQYSHTASQDAWPLPYRCAGAGLEWIHRFANAAALGRERQLPGLAASYRYVSSVARPPQPRRTALWGPAAAYDIPALAPHHATLSPARRSGAPQRHACAALPPRHIDRCVIEDSFTLRFCAKEQQIAQPTRNRL